MIIRKHNLTLIPNEILRDNNLTLKAKGLLCFMLSLDEDTYITEQTLSDLTNTGLKSIKSGLKELEDAKYLYRTQSKNDSSQFNGVTYHLYDTPQ